jgi:peptide/nickel transport system substrate-binding protein
MFNVTRRQAFAASGGLLATLLAPQRFASAAAGNTLNIAYNVNLPSFDPDVGPSSVNPTIQAIYRSVFDQYIGQKPNLAFEPGLITSWGWSDDKSKAWMDVRENVVWHDGSPFTPEDVVWSIQREGKPDGGNPVAFIWAGLDNFKVDGHRITADVKQYDPVIFKWMAFLTGYVLPKAYYEKVGPQGFEKKPIGTGPYMVDAYEATPTSGSRPIRNTGAASQRSKPWCSSSYRTRPAASPRSRAAPRTSLLKCRMKSTIGFGSKPG